MANPTAVTIPSRYSTTPATFAFTAATGSEQLLDWMPGDILLALNDHATDPKTITIVSNPKNRRTTYTISAHSLNAGTYRVLPRFPPQDDDTLSVTGSSTDIKFAQLSTAPQPS